MIFSKLIIQKEPPALTRIERIEKVKNILKANIGKEITINFYIIWETKSVNYKTTGIIIECFGFQDVIIKTENNIEFINIRYIIDYSFH